MALDKEVHEKTGLHKRPAIETVYQRLDAATRGVDLKEWAKIRAAILVELDRIRSETLTGKFP